MFLLRRVFLDGPERPEIVLLHYTLAVGAPSDAAPRHRTVVVPPGRREGTREVTLFIPEPPPGLAVSLRYFFSTVRAGSEWFSPAYDLVLPGGERGGDLSRVPDAEGGNAGPAPGCGWFRLRLPLREEEPRTGTAHYGFGAVRKKPEPGICRGRLPLAEGEPPVLEAPEALAVLKGRPMPYYLHHFTEGGPGLFSDKIASARITLRDEAGDLLCARLLWADPSWAAPNLSVMDLVKGAGEPCPAAGYFFAEDRAAWLADRFAALSRVPPPRTFEAYVFGPSGSRVEYCFQVLRRRPDGGVFGEWRNLEGGNFAITL